MTKQLPGVNAFPNWHYKMDPTHVVFYQRKTFSWIAGRFGYGEPVFVDDRVVLMQRLGGAL